MIEHWGLCSGLTELFHIIAFSRNTIWSRNVQMKHWSHSMLSNKRTCVMSVSKWPGQSSCLSGDQFVIAVKWHSSRILQTSSLWTSSLITPHFCLNPSSSSYWLTSLSLSLMFFHFSPYLWTSSLHLPQPHILAEQCRVLRCYTHLYKTAAQTDSCILYNF